MIQLYKASNTNYDMNGDYTLSPLSCTFECKLNDSWIVNIDNIIDDSINDFINGAVLSVPTPYGDKQLFRIYDYEKTDEGITAIAYPIFLDSKNDCFIWDTRPTNKNGQQALDDMLKSNPKYSASSDIKKISTAYYIQKNFIEALNGQDDNSFINRWGGEVAYNNFEIIVNEHLGNDNGLRVEFGFNLLGVSEKVDDSNVVTRIIPKAYNGHILPNNETVDSPLINNYPIIHTKVIEYNDIKLKEDSNVDEENVIVCNTLNDLYIALRKRANEEFENGIDIPNITYNVDMIDLSKTDLYEDYKDLLKVNLGDTVNVKNRKLNIETKARVISLVYDCITKKVERLVLGQFEPNYFNDVSSITHSVNKVIDTSNNTLMGNRIAGVINLLKTSLKAQKDIAQKQDVRAILFEDLDNSSPTFGAMCLGTQGIQISKKRNPTNTDWVWGTAIDFQSVIADYIITGILSDKLGNNFWNLDTGELNTKNMHAENAYISGELNSSKGIIGGFKITNEGLTKTAMIQLPKVYTKSDMDRIQNIIMGHISPTSEDYRLYDIDKDGRITSADWLRVEQVFVPIQSDKLYTDVILNSYPYDPNNINQPMLLVRYRGASGKVAMSSEISARQAIVHFFNAVSITTKYISCYKGNGDYSISTDNIDIIARNGGEGNHVSCGDLYGGTYSGSDNVYLRSFSGYLALYSVDNAVYYNGNYIDDNWSAGKFYPSTNGKVALGTSGNRWYRLYSSNASSESSDERLKTNITKFDERFIKLFEMLEPIMYNWIEHPENNKEAGLIAQKVQKAMKDCNITDEEFGCVDYSDEKGYLGLIYRHFSILTMYYVQYQKNNFEKYKKSIEERLKRLEDSHGNDN